MTTITINPRTKAGKTLLELARLLSEKNSGVFINEEKISKKQTQWIKFLMQKLCKQCTMPRMVLD
jgi:hypothetical protein